MRIEPATAQDVEALADVWVDLADTQRRHGSHLEADANREEVQPLLAHHVVRGTALVARDDEGAPIGFVNFGIEEGALESDATRGIVHNLYVEPGSRGEGVGSALLDAAESALVERGADVVAIEALWDNEAARRLYRRRGYEPHRVQFERTAETDANLETGESDTNSKEGD